MIASCPITHNGYDAWYMPDTYVACPMSSLSTAEYETLRQTVLAMCDALQAAGHTPYREPFETTGDFPDPAAAFEKNIRTLDGAKTFILIYLNKEATSALIELGYALKRGIQIIVFAKAGVTLPYYLRDNDTTRYGIRIVPFANEAELPALAAPTLS